MAGYKQIDPKSGEKTQFKPGQSGNPNGRAKGSLSLSTHIQNLMNDEQFEANILDSKLGYQEYKGIPITAIIKVAIQRALNDKDKAIQYMEWIAKYGYGSNVEGSSEEIDIKFEYVNKVPTPKEK